MKNWSILVSIEENYISSSYILYFPVFGALGNHKMLLIFIHIPGGCGWVDVQFSVCTYVCVFAYESRG